MYGHVFIMCIAALHILKNNFDVDKRGIGNIWKELGYFCYPFCGVFFNFGCTQLAISGGVSGFACAGSNLLLTLNFSYKSCSCS